MVEPVVFARIGWMTFYRGPQKGDEKPISGGKYTETELGHEAFNFVLAGRKVFGYFQPPMQSHSIKLERVVPGCSTDKLAGVTVVFVATHPRRGQRVVGWYQHAILFRTAQPDKAVNRGKFPYYASTDAKDAVLLPTWQRTQSIPSGKGGFGRSNVRYLYEGGDRLKLKWADDALSYIHEYSGGNLLKNPELEAAPEIEHLLDETIGKAAGYESNSKIRDAIEFRAMEVTKTHWRRRGFKVEDVHKNQSYDFRCTAANKTVYVEVKGTRSLGQAISLTRAEVEFARKKTTDTVLCVVHSINVNGKRKPKASGGHLISYVPWNPDQHRLRPVAYVCTLKPATS